MTIKQVSEKYNISQDTLRYYEKEGIILPVTRKNGIRNYGEKELANIEFVLCMRNAGLSVEVLKEYLKLFEKGKDTEEECRQLLINEREKLKSKISDMNAALERLNYKIDVYYNEIVEKEKTLMKEKN